MHDEAAAIHQRASTASVGDVRQHQQAAQQHRDAARCDRLAAQTDRDLADAEQVD
jgi:hypothetical protein